MMLAITQVDRSNPGPTGSIDGRTIRRRVIAHPRGEYTAAAGLD
jgi:hypothetical protein